MKKYIYNVLRSFPLSLSIFRNIISIDLWNLFTKQELKVITKPVDITEGIESKNEELTLLWLDDRINPLDSRMDWLAYSPLGREVNVVWIKSYSEFRRWLELNGQPDGICFDYNLGINVPTGYDCAQYLISYCRRNKLKLPVWSSQCPNPVEKAKINRLLKSALAVSEH